MVMLTMRMSSDIKISKARVISQFRCTSIQNEEVAHDNRGESALGILR